MTFHIIGEASGMDDIHRVLRDRAEEIGASRMTLDEATGLPSGYSAKLLCNPPIKGLGKLSLGLMLQTLGLRLLVVEDPDATAAVAPLLPPKHASRDTRSKVNQDISLRPDIQAIVARRVREEMKAQSSRGGFASQRSKTPEQRQAQGRRGAMARWHGQRASNAAATGGPSE
ncbi:MAG TPA: hypothetical protein VNQ99_16205 [Xanthobacteraceae bacterium]|nr:hypothetical protein [Xanthobacteraceae bacterium]